MFYSSQHISLGARKGGRTLRKCVFLPSKRLLSAFYNTPPPSKNPSKNPSLNWSPYQAPSKNPSKKHLLVENLLSTLLRVACGCMTPLALRAQRLKKLKIALRDWNFQARMKISIPDRPPNPFFYCGNSGRQDWKFQDVKIEVFKRKLETFKRDCFFFNFWALRVWCAPYLPYLRKSWDAKTTSFVMNFHIGENT